MKLNLNSVLGPETLDLNGCGAWMEYTIAHSLFTLLLYRLLWNATLYISYLSLDE